MVVFNCLKLHWVAKKVVVNESLDGWVGEELLVAHDETVVHITVVGKVESSVLKEVVVELMKC